MAGGDVGHPLGAPAGIAGSIGAIGQVIRGRHRLVSQIEVNDIGTVYLGQALDGGPSVAVLLAHPHLTADAAWTQRFYAEAFACSHLVHPNTIRTLDVGLIADGPLFLISELVDGPSLREVLQSGPLAPERVLRILIQCCAALAEAHAFGRRHHDLRPEKIFLTMVAGSPDVVKLAQFSVYRPHEPGRLSQPGTARADPSYLSPEQIQSAMIDERTDVYALGAIGYAAVTGAPPFRGTEIAVMRMHLQDPPPPLPAAVPAPVQRILARALAKDPARRYQSAGDLMHHCQQVYAALTSPPAGGGYSGPLRSGVAPTLVGGMPAPAARDGRPDLESRGSAESTRGEPQRPTDPRRHAYGTEAPLTDDEDDAGLETEDTARSIARGAPGTAAQTGRPAHGTAAPASNERGPAAPSPVIARGPVTLPEVPRGLPGAPRSPGPEDAPRPRRPTPGTPMPPIPMRGPADIPMPGSANIPMPGPPSMPTPGPEGLPGMSWSEVLPLPDERDGVAAQATRELSIGLSPHDAAAAPIVDASLAPDTAYWLWVEIAEQPIAGAMAGMRPPLPALPDAAELDVVLFSSPDQLAITEDQRRGRLALRRSRAWVAASAALPAAAGELTEHRLYFPIRTPARSGAATVRVNVYVRGTLLQSHIVTAEIATAPRRGPGQLHSALDYAISSLAIGTAEFDRLRDLPPPQLSLQIDQRPRTGTHAFRFFAAGDPTSAGFVAEASLDGTQLAAMIDYARGALRTAAWGSDAPWDPDGDRRYRYAQPTSAQLAEDLIRLARHGARLWSDALIAFGIHDRQLAELRARIRTPGALQLALHDGPRHVFPAALVYDHPLDAGRAALALCPRFLTDLAAGTALEDAVCFRGACPAHGDKRIVCPSGFWGFRHEIGVAPHLRGREIATAVGERLAAKWLLVAMVSTDPRFTQRAQHLAELQRMPELDTIVIDERERCISALEVYAPHISYFYCHGGVTASGTPFLVVGPRDADMITSDSFTDLLRDEHAPRPLIVLNGCHTTATTPAQAFDLASGFLAHANAAGVVGTEITVFEPLARAFGETLLRQFVGGATLGAAVRRARLRLLAQSNPLGLAYVAFALPALALTAPPPAQPAQNWK